ncbi:PadR family transcriptional regulator [Candidatus Bathyarchaeota archaeon]|nr:PadR family transcriptional regulator [Candidatus Bathyarchaeota archaeon]
MNNQSTETSTREIIKKFLDLIILGRLGDNSPMSGYDIIKYIHQRFHILQSPSTVYSALYSLERQNLIQGKTIQGKRAYRLTPQGEQRLKNIHKTKNKLQTLLTCIFPDSEIHQT